MEIEQTNQNATKAVAFSFWLTRQLADGADLLSQTGP
jgi:hypothetical protein